MTLLRILEIRDAVLARGRPGHYFEKFDASLVDIPSKLKHFEHLEAELTGLDDAAWAYLRAQAIPLFEKKHPLRGWQAAFDKLNEAKAYNYLTRLGCTGVNFIPVSSEAWKKTPDLKAKLGSQEVLCEVKTINPSDVEAHRRSSVAKGQFVVRSTQGSLPEAFFDKLTRTVAMATKQMSSYRPQGDARQIVYVILNFDDSLNEYVDDYLEQIHGFVISSTLAEIELVFDVKPKFYSATSRSTGSKVIAYANR